MNQYTLKFESKQIEREYYDAQLKTLQQNVTLVSFYYFFTSVQAMILRFFEKDDPYYFMLGLHLGVTTIFVALLNYVAWRYPKWITPLCQLFSIAHTFVNVRMIKRQERITPYLAIYSFLFMLIHLRFSQHFIIALLVIIVEHIFMIAFLFGYGFEYDRFCTYMILSLIIYLITEFQREKQRRYDFLQRQLDLKSAKTWKYVMLEIQPQITALMSIHTVNNELKWKVKEINKIAQDEFNIDGEEKFNDFLETVLIDNQEGDEINENNETQRNLIDRNLFLEINNYVKKHFNQMMKRTDTYFKKDPSKCPDPIVLFGYYQQYKFKIILAKIFYLNEETLLLKMENLSWEDEIKKLKEMDQYKDRLLANVSHDLRTPLIGINYNFDQIEAGQGKEEILKYKKQGKANSDLLMSYINDILDYCQMKEQRIKLNLTSFNLIRLLQEAVDLLNIPAQLKGICITLKNLISNEGDWFIYSDERRIKQIIINLLSNSLKFTKKGGKIQLFVRTHKNDKIKIEVVDTGAGIKKEVIPELAKPFATFGIHFISLQITLDNDSQMNKQGIGLGLSICKKLIGLLGPTNKLFISSEVGKGSKFGFLLFNKCKELKLQNHKDSLKQIITSQFQEENQNWNGNQQLIAGEKLILENNTDESEVFSTFKLTEESIQEGVDDICVTMPHQFKKINQLACKTNNPSNFFNKYANQQLERDNNQNEIKILIADDNPFNILVLESYLKKIQDFTFNVLTATNGQEALEAFQQCNKFKFEGNNINIIVMDCDMPIMNGFQSAQNIRQLIENEDFAEVEIIGYTCYEGDKEKCQQSGMNSFLSKPATEQSFTQFILNICNQNQQN